LQPAGAAVVAFVVVVAVSVVVDPDFAEEDPPPLGIALV
jgi:hypothetical protein